MTETSLAGRPVPTPGMGPGNMGAGEGFFWVALLIGGTGIAGFIVGAIIGFGFERTFSTGFAGGIIAISILYAIALARGSSRKQYFKVIERVLKFWDIKMAGLHLAWPFIDVIRFAGDFKIRDVELFKDGSNVEEIDFIDASAPADISAYWRIGDPNAAGDEGQWQLREDILNYVYLFTDEDRGERVVEVFEKALRPILQRRTIDEAQTGSNEASKLAAEDAKEILKPLGVYPAASCIVIRDIAIPPAIQELRQLKLKGEKEAAEQAARGGGYWGAVQVIIDAAAAKGITLTKEEAMEFYRQNRAFEVTQSAERITYVAKDVSGVLGTVQLGGTNGSSNP